MPPGGVVHLRLNDPNTSRNPHINFITALDLPDKADALRRLHQLAAMVKPVMAARSLQINSLEEFEHNSEFAGRCWNYGENVELVLRDQRGAFLPLQVVLMVFCHELAHIKHMNHIPRLHGKLNAELREHCKELQAKGYYGDGLWSAGRRLADSGWVGGNGMMQPGQMLPQDVCGGAFRRKGAVKGKGSSSKRRRVAAPGSRSFKGPSLHTGAQTARNITSNTSKRRVLKSFGAGGSRVDGANELPPARAKSEDYKKDPNSSFRKRTQAPSAREARVAAALARMEREKREKEMQKKEEEEHKARGSDKLDVLRWDQPEYARDGDEEEDGSETEDEDEEDAEGGVYVSGDEEGDEREDSRDATPGKRKMEDGLESGCTSSQPPSTMASRETAEQRARRTQRARAADAEASKNGGADQGWGELLRQSGMPTAAEEAPGTSAAGPSQARVAATSTQSELASHVKKESKAGDDDDDDSIIIVGEKRAMVKAPSELPNQTKTRAMEVPPSRSPRDPPMNITWPCLVCTLENQPSVERCAVCETTRGQSTMGA